jgi:hypothetical protein
MTEPHSTRDSPFGSSWLDVYTFPWQISNLWIWVLLTAAMMILALIFCGFAALIALMKEHEFSSAAFFVWTGSARIFGGLCLLTILFSIFPAAYFLSVVEDTANGNEEVEWSDLLWYEALWKWLLLLWVFGCCMAVSTVAVLCVRVVLPLPAALAWATALAFALLLFPIPLLSTLIGGAPWILVHPTLLVRLAQEPLAGLGLYVHSVVFMVPCLGLGFWMILERQWWLAPIVGIIWSTCFLCYARALGQAAFVLAQDDRRRRRKKKRRRVRARQESED